MDKQTGDVPAGPVRARRALLYVPGDDRKKINKAATLGVDCVCLDMEDGVAATRKVEARAMIEKSLQEVAFGRSERLVRINPVGSGMEAEDLKAALLAYPDGIVVPKVENAGQLRWVSAEVGAFERSRNLSSGGIRLFAIVETARGIINLAEIAGSDDRLDTMIFGAEDLAGDVGAIRTRQAWEVFYARSAVVTYAAAYDLQAIDMVFVDIHDHKGLEEESLQGLQMGYAGKQIIHPEQVPVVQDSFTPSETAIQNALRVVEAFNAHQDAGVGAFSLDGKMVEAPMLKAAERVLARAEAAGKMTG